MVGIDQERLRQLREDILFNIFLSLCENVSDDILVKSYFQTKSVGLVAITTCSDKMMRSCLWNFLELRP